MKRPPSNKESFWSVRYTACTDGRWKEQCNNFPDRHYKKFVAFLTTLSLFPKDFVLYHVSRQVWDPSTERWTVDRNCQNNIYGLHRGYDFSKIIEKAKLYAGVKE